MALTLTEEDLPAIEKLYKKAVKEKQDRFKYRDHDVLTAYAKYLIEYMKSHGKSKR